MKFKKLKCPHPGKITQARSELGSESETDLLPRRILHQQGISTGEWGACIEDNHQ